MSAALQIVDDQSRYNREDLDLLKTTIAAGLEDKEFALLVKVAERRRLDLFAKQLYGVKRSGKMTLQTSIDGYRLLAGRSHRYAGSDDAVFSGAPKSPAFMATVTVYRMTDHQRCPFTASARWPEYYSSFGGMWDKMPYTMLAKCAEALALRKAFPEEVSGIYTDDEMMQADNPAGRVVDASSAPVQRAAVVPSVLGSLRDEQITMQKLYSLAQQLGFDGKKWAALKRECNNDATRIAARLDELAPPATLTEEQVDASLFGAFGDGPLS